MFSLVTTLQAALDCQGTAWRPMQATPPSRPRPVGLSWTVRWDGSFREGAAAVGITVARGDTRVLEVGLGVLATDASRTEALGPALAALLLRAASPKIPGRVTFIGDSAAVVDLTNRCSPP